MTRCYFVGEHFRDTLIDEVISDITNERESFPGGNANAKGARINVFARWIRELKTEIVYFHCTSNFWLFTKFLRSLRLSMLCKSVFHFGSLRALLFTGT